MANSEQQALAWLRHLEIARPGAVASQPSSGPIHYFAPPRERHRLRTRRRHSIRERHADGCDRGIAFFMTTTLLPGECGVLVLIWVAIAPYVFLQLQRQ